MAWCFVCLRQENDVARSGCAPLCGSRWLGSGFPAIPACPATARSHANSRVPCSTQRFPAPSASCPFTSHARHTLATMSTGHRSYANMPQLSENKVVAEISLGFLQHNPSLKQTLTYRCKDIDIHHIDHTYHTRRATRRHPDRRPDESAARCSTGVPPFP